MVSSVSSSNAVQQAYQMQMAQHQHAKPASKSSQPEDTVHLSHAAKPTGDVDHDGDSK
jgi:hypothetical protein